MRLFQLLRFPRRLSVGLCDKISDIFLGIQCFNESNDDFEFAFCRNFFQWEEFSTFLNGWYRKQNWIN